MGHSVGILEDKNDKGYVNSGCAAHQDAKGIKDYVRKWVRTIHVIF